VPADQQVMFPATCVETALGRPLDRLELLAAILEHFFALRSSAGTVEFIRLWQQRLAFIGEDVQVDLLGAHEALVGRVLGVDENGNLRLRTQAGNEVNVAAGDVRLRPLA
jgi:BirA family transcriptional regulator, biotin operon repressor / biotin---[acetyl-CoA-carboxylase] ligase